MTAYAEGSVIITVTANDGSGCSDTASIEVVLRQEEPESSQPGQTTSSESKPSGQPKTGDGFLLFPILLLGCLSIVTAVLNAASYQKKRED